MDLLQTYIDNSRVISNVRSRFPFLSGLLKNTSWLYSATLLGQVTGFFLTLFIARRFPVADYGIIGLVIAYCSTVNRLLDFRIWETVINYFGSYVAQQENRKAIAVLRLCYGIDISTGVLAFAVVVFTAELAATLLLEDKSLSWLIRLYSISLLVNTADGTSSATLRVYDKFNWLAIIDAISSFTKLVSVVTLVTWHPTLEAVFWAYLLTEFVRAASVNWLAWRFTTQKLDDMEMTTSSLSFTQIKEILKFTINTNIFGTLKQISTKSDLLVIGIFASTAEVGLFKMASTILTVPIQIMTQMYRVTYPAIVRVKESRDHEDLIDLLKSSSIMSTMILGTLSLGMFIFMSPVLELAIGKQEYISAIPYMRIMLIGLMVHFSFFWLRSVLVAYNRVHFMNLAQFARVIFWTIGAVVLIPLVGGIGAAYVYALSWLFWVAIQSLYIKRVGLIAA